MAIDSDPSSPRHAAHDVPMRITRCTPACAFACPCFYPYPWYVWAQQAQPGRRGQRALLQSGNGTNLPVVRLS